MLNNTVSQISEASSRQLPMRFLLWNDLVNQIGEETLWGYGFNSYPAINPIHQSKEVREKEVHRLGQSTHSLHSLDWSRTQ